MISTYLFDDPVLDELFKTKAKNGDCEITGRTELCIGVDDLLPYFEPLVQIYEPYPHAAAAAIFEGGSPNDEGTYVWEAIENDFGVFSPQNDQEDNQAIIEYLFYEDPRDGGYNPYADQPVFRFDNHFSYDDENYYREKYWSDFKEEIRSVNRFFPQNSLNFDELRQIFDYRKREISVGEKFFRARVGVAQFSPSEMGSPPNHLASVGRANPKGISYLYLGKNKEICELEIKVSKGTSYTIGEFQVTRALNIVDLTNHYIVSPFYFKKELKSYINNIELIKMYAKELSSKASVTDPYLDYLATQYVCERIKLEGYDGILFKSSLRENIDDLNLTLFSDSGLNCVNTKMCISK